MAVVVPLRQKKWRECMGIEPTEPFSRKDPTGFEDQAEHQLGCTPVWGGAASRHESNCASVAFVGGQ
jgi:hypothetical protein